MSLDRRAVDQQPRRRAARRRQSLEDARPDTFLGPAYEAVVERLAGPVGRRRVDPTPTGFQHVNDPADDAPVVHPRLAARVGRKMRLKPRKLSIAQPEMISIHRRSPFGDLESQNCHSTKRSYGSGA